MNKRLYYRVMVAFFIMNAAFLVWATLWKCGMPFIGDAAQRVINVIPFQGNTLWEMQFNIFLFVPFGLTLSAIRPWKVSWRVLIVAATSILLEIVQYALAVGTSDITDVLLNTLGGLVGIAAHGLLVKLFAKHSHAAILTVCALIIALEVYMSISFILFGMVRFGVMMVRI